MSNTQQMFQGAQYRQREIYIEGFSGKMPNLPTTYGALERMAKDRLNAKAFGYIAGGAGEGRTMSNNDLAFDQYVCKPRMLQMRNPVDMGIRLLGSEYSTPFLLAPIGALCLAHKEADLAVARAARTYDLPYIFSCQASVSMEDCAGAMGSAPRWFQLYYSKLNGLTQSLLQRAESVGSQAIVVTLDTTVLGWRPMDLDQGYLPFLEGRGLAQYYGDPFFRNYIKENNTSDVQGKITIGTIINGLKMKKRLAPVLKRYGMPKGSDVKIIRNFIAHYSRPLLSWEDLERLREWTRLPLLLKGITHVMDAVEAEKRGFDGIVVSNHGGRQVDGAVSSLEALVKIREHVHEDFPLILDSGVYGGARAFKALALGANAVCIGRPYAYALGINGESGVSELINNYLSELELTMTLCGCPTLSEINGNYVEKR